MKGSKPQRPSRALFAALLLFAFAFIVSSPHQDLLQPTMPEKPISTTANEDATVIASDDVYGTSYAVNGTNPMAPNVAATENTTVKTSLSQKIQESKARRATIVAGSVAYPVRVYKPLLVPNDPLANQWWPSAINLPSMWDIPTAQNEVTLAVIDTGFALKHEEFENRWHKNSGETGSTTTEGVSLRNCTDRGITLNKNCNLIDDNSDGIVDNETGTTTYQNPSRLTCTDQGLGVTKDCNRIDDDSNGYIDDVTGWDFVNYDNSVQAGEVSPAGTGTTHGTQVSGVAAATGNNNKGIAGVAWNTKILPIQVIDDDSYGDTFGVERAIRYAADQGADVINISLGSDEPDDYVRIAVQYALSKGSVVVAAAGNDGCACMSYPARYDEVVSVGATDTTMQRASFSSYGSALDIVAPGTNITAPSWRSTNQNSAYSSGIAGTSFSAPMVSGLLSQLARQQPSATPIQLIAALKENTIRLSIPVSTPHNDQLGFGMLDTEKSLQRMTQDRTGEQVYTLGPTATNSSDYAILCELGALPGSPLYTLSKGAERKFTLNEVERQQAIIAGFSANLLSYVCIRQPHDDAFYYRSININREFFNDYSKKN